MTSPLLTRATRNALTIRWLRACDPVMRRSVRDLYAAHLGAPDCELGTDAEFTQDADALEWIAATYVHTLAAFAEDEL